VRDILGRKAMSISRRFRAAVTGLLSVLLALPPLARAAPGTPTSAVRPAIVLGSSGEFSGQGLAKENIDGARVYVDWINQRGGVAGRRLELKARDDGRDVRRAVENTEALIAQDKVFALFGYRGTPSVEAVLPLITRERVPLVAPFTGAESIRSPLNPWVFHLRASYRQEAARLVHQLSSVGVRRMALLHQDDAFGKDALAGFDVALKKAGIVPLATAKYDRKDLDVTGASRVIGQASPDAVLMACSPKACLDFIRQMRAAGHRAQFLTLSNVNSDEFAKGLQGDTRGVVVAQVVPNPWNVGVPLAREFQQAIKETASQVPLSYSSFEGFVAAKLVVTALRRAGPDPTREKFTAALEAMHELDLGGLMVSFSAAEHRGSNFVDLTLVTRDGRYIR
jgi:ABC-type branched-subunit amino acid transport system substrate-binding protein